MTTDSIGFGHVDLGGDALGGNARPCASYTLSVNGVERPVTDAWIGESLLYVLRERLGLAGAKDGCEQGECGACSVQVDGQLVAGCLVPAALASDSEIATVEGLSAAGTASDVQQALADSGAVQCGYCTPGMAMAVHDLLQRNHRPSEVEARQALCGNLCRCTGYRGALAAVQAVAEARGAVDEEPLEPTDLPEPAEASEASGPSGQSHEPPAVPAQSAADLPLAGEMPLYADSEVWVEADQPYADQPYPGPDQQYPAQPTAAGTGVGVGIDYGVAPTTHQTGVYEPAGYPAYTSTPPHGTPFDASYDPAYDAVYEQGRYEATPAHGTAHDGTSFEGTPAHGTPYIPTPAHGTPYESTVYESYDGTTPAHGIRLPEDDHA